MISEKEFSQLARQLRPRLMRTAAGVLGTASAACEDVVQDTLLKLWDIRADIDRYRSVEALACVIAHRLALNVVRASSAGRFVELDQCMAATPSAEDDYLASERGRRLDAVLESMPEAQRTLIRLRHIDGYDNRAIADLLGTTEGAVRTALSRARRQVANIFGVSSL